ncbi:hypothetical protein SELMODRAFT_424886 [Selaginella moellendorffii]|uniref:Calponin-homology (CH) domain-containing protein n=1 Tax=Selaginella moellendorffii TaxID=88036 RepID=D8SRB6_SELML|nr:hypothetical protein SELMODRAFT_424886 [Selaginella moellendorffii]
MSGFLVFGVWINILGTTTYVDQLFDGVWDGWILLEILEKLEPGSINWKAANKPLIKMPFKNVENCNQALDAARKLRLSLVKVTSFKAITSSYSVAFLWQLMRYHTLHLLKNIKLRGKEVSDYDILKRANNKVKRSGKDSHDEKKQNAVYVISVARKLGCSVFLLWHDIVRGETQDGDDLGTHRDAVREG